MRVRAYRDEDADEAVRFFVDIARADPSIEGVSEDGWRKFASMSSNRGGRDFLVGEDDEDDEGYAAFATSTLYEQAQPGLRHFRILVHPRARRRGWGKRLLREVEGQDAGHETTLQSNVLEKWRAGSAFAEREGFCETRRQLMMKREGAPPPAAVSPEGFLLRAYDGTGKDDQAWKRLAIEGFGGPPDYADPSDADLEHHRSATRFHLWMAERDGEICGLCHSFDWQDVEPTINAVVVTQSARGQGLGHALTTAGVRAALEGGRDEVSLNVLADNTPAVTIYRALDFQTTDELVTWQKPRAES